MEGFENNGNQESDIELVDFPFICRICLKRSDSRLFKMEDFLFDLYLSIIKINVHATANLPKNVCNDCVKTLEDISLFIDVSKCKEAKSRKKVIPKNANEHVEPAECGTSQNDVIKIEETIEEYQDLKYFKGFEICRICYSTNILKPVEEKAHLMQLFHNITNVVKAEDVFSDKNSICNKCIKELETISLFVSVSLSHEIKLKNTVERYESQETENCLEENLIDMGDVNKLKKDDDFDEKAYSYEINSLHTIIDIKEEIVDTEACIEQVNRNEINIFSESCFEENPFDRDSCNDEFTNGTHVENLLKGLDINLEIQSGTNRFKYDSCDENFTKQQSLKRHMLAHTKEKPFKCEYCFKKFVYKSYLQQHEIIHTGEKPFKCDCCLKSFYQKGNLQKHMIIHTGEKPFTCDICRKSFTQKHSLKTHSLTHTGQKPFKCDICKKCFCDKKYLRAHLLTHAKEKQFKCNCCERSFNNKSNMQRHMVIHTGEKQFKCDMCGRRFSVKQHLKTHLLSHTGEKPYKCDCCSKSSAQKGSLQRHMIVQSGEKQFECNFCGKGFSRKQNLKTHLLSHTGEKPYKCDCCLKSFTQKVHWQTHMIVHSGEKQFKCNFCKRSFTRKQTLKTHLVTHTGEKPFKCGCCLKSFNQKGNLQRHMLSH